MNLNNLRVEVYSSGTTRIVDMVGELQNAERIQFSTGYSGGLYLDASFNIPRDIAQAWEIKGTQRLVIRNGQNPVFEGKIGDLDRALQRNTEGIKIKAVGYFGALLGSRRLRRLYADQRTSEDVWTLQIGGTDVNAPFINIGRYDLDNDKNQLRITPQDGYQWDANSEARLRYIAPTGEEIRRIDFDYDFDEGGGDWKLVIRDVSNATDLRTVSTTGSGTGQNEEPASGCSVLDFKLVTNANAFPSIDRFAELSNVTVYATMNHAPASLATVDLTEITKDIRAELTDLSADESKIGSNTLSLVPFIAERFPYAADILIEAASYGDSSQNRWAVGVLASDLSSDKKPLLFVEQYPVLTDYDYAVRIDKPPLEPTFDISEGYIGADENKVWNWIVVQYRDEQGFAQYVTPDDDANLKDADSIIAWGQRDRLLKIRHGDATVATNFGRRFLGSHKDPVWHMTKPIKVKGSIKAKSGNLVPASEIRAGRRIRVENFLRDPALGIDDLIFLITKTDYDDNKEICTITTGRPDSLDVILAQQELEAARS